MKTTTLAALIFAFAVPVSANAMIVDPTRLALTFETGAATGAVMVSLFDSKAAYDGGRPVQQATIDVAAGARSVVFRDLPPGTYAVKAFHDVNGDGRMNVNPFGIPTEPFAFSNNARGNMGPATWDHAQLTVTGETTHIIAIR